MTTADTVYLTSVCVIIVIISAFCDGTFSCCRKMVNLVKINLKVGSRQNLKNRMDVRREFCLQKKNILATMFECTMHQLHENLCNTVQLGSCSALDFLSPEPFPRQPCGLNALNT